MKPEYREGPEALKRFEEGMAKLFNAKPTPKKQVEQKRKQGKTSKG